MTILEQIDSLAACITKMTIKRAKHFCDLYEALYVVVCDFDDPNGDLHKILEERIQKIRKLENSIIDYETGKAITLGCAIEVLGAINDSTSKA